MSHACGSKRINPSWSICSEYCDIERWLYSSAISSDIESSAPISAVEASLLCVQPDWPWRPSFGVATLATQHVLLANRHKIAESNFSPTEEVLGFNYFRELGFRLFRFLAWLKEQGNESQFASRKQRSQRQQRKLIRWQRLYREGRGTRWEPLRE